MTKKLFYDNSFMQEFDAVVISCENDKKGWAVVLDQTAFYPEGGGQPRDQGVIAFGQTTVNVLDTREKNGVIIHYTDGEIPAEIFCQHGDAVGGNCAADICARIYNARSCRNVAVFCEKRRKH